MPYYWVWIYLKDGSYHSGLRKLDADLETAKTHFASAAEKHYKNIREVKVYETNDVPVEFEFEGKVYKGVFSMPHGPNVSTWFLMIDNFYCGKLLIQQNKWVFYGPASTEKWSKLADYFGNVVTGKADT